MNILFSIYFFILGAVLGSFYNVVGWRLPNGESIISPPSHCPKCGHRLKPLELIPIISFFIQKGKCRECQEKISWYYPAFEFISGLLFAVSFLVFGFSTELLIALTFISMLLIIVVSDIHYMIIPDEILVTFSIILAIEIGILNGYQELLWSFVHGLSAFITMFLLKLLGDFIFKKESMGGGDIKLMFVFGFVLGYPLAILSIFVGSIVGLPISLLLLKKNSEHIVPFGPFLSIGAIILLLTRIDFSALLAILNR